MRWLAGVLVCGVVACWISQEPAKSPSRSTPIVATPVATDTSRPADVPVAIAADASVPVAAVPATCGRDEVREYLCGGMGIGGADPCGPTAASLASAGWQRLVITVLTRGMKGEKPVLDNFMLDDPETQRYRASIPPSGAGLPGPFCCYTRCTPLVVGASALVPKPPPGFHTADMCIPAPTATNAPARDRQCPGAIEWLGELRPYRGPLVVSAGGGRPWWFSTSNASCCYTTVVRNPPPDHDRDSCPTCRCAAAGTMIETPSGEVAIEDLRVGDLVMSMHAGRLQAVPLRAVHHEPVHDHVMVVATLANGRTVAMSPQHPTADGGRFQELAAGSQLGGMRVVDVARVPYTGAFTYDLLPESDTATYVASGALVGSTLR